MIGRKQASTHSDWVQAWDRARTSPDHARAEELIEEAAARVRSRVAAASRPVLAWSGGKDSLALRLVAERAGVAESVLVLSALEWPAFEEWVGQHRPPELSVVRRDTIDMAWLTYHPDMLFPDTAQAAARWFAAVQHTGQRQHAAATGMDLMLLGRRLADGNHCGTRGALGHEYEDRAGFTRYSPIADWSHEDVLNVLAHAAVDLPPIYRWPDGYKIGTGPWPSARRLGSLAENWAYVATIDPDLVRAAADAGLPGAAEALTH